MCGSRLRTDRFVCAFADLRVRASLSRLFTCSRRESLVLLVFATVEEERRLLSLSACKEEESRIEVSIQGLP